jgi:hypothetical protein
MIMNVISSEYDFETKRQASKYIHETCFTSSLTLQMFIACRGLPVLVSFLEHTDITFLQLKEIIYYGINGIIQVFNIPLSSCSTPKNDFCRIFAKSKIMHHLSKVLYNLLIIMKDEKEEKELIEYNKYLKNVLIIIQLFSASDR